MACHRLTTPINQCWQSSMKQYYVTRPQNTLFHIAMDCLLKILFRLTTKKQPSKLYITCPLCWETKPPVTRRFPTQIASDGESVHISWSHQVSVSPPESRTYLGLITDGKAKRISPVAHKSSSTAYANLTTASSLGGRLPTRHSNISPVSVLSSMRKALIPAAMASSYVSRAWQKETYVIKEIWVFWNEYLNDDGWVYICKTRVMGLVGDGGILWGLPQIWKLF